MSHNFFLSHNVIRSGYVVVVGWFPRSLTFTFLGPVVGSL